MTGCDHVGDAVGHAFSALEPDEDRALLEHLPHCGECRRALAEALDVVAALGAAVPRVDPPAGLRGRVLEAVQAEPVVPLPPRRHRPAPRPVTADDTPPVVSAPAATFPRASDAGGRSWRSVAALAVAAVTLGLGLIIARAAIPTETGPAPESPSVTLADQADRVVGDAEQRNPQVRHATLRDSTGDPVAVVLQDATGPRMVALGLPQAEPAQDYVLWTTAASAATGPVAVATMDPDDGVTRPIAATPGDTNATPPRGYAVSVERTGQVPARPTTVVAVGALV